MYVVAVALTDKRTGMRKASQLQTVIIDYANRGVLIHWNVETYDLETPQTRVGLPV